MKRFLSFTIALTLLFGCATDISRDIANDADAPLTYNELMTFSSTSQVDAAYDATTNQNISITFEAKYVDSTKLTADEAFKLDAGIIDQQFKMIITHSKKSKADRGASKELNLFMNHMREKLASQYGVMELIHNARNGDISALTILARLRKDAAASYLESQVNTDSNAEIEERVKYWTDKLKEFEKAERAHENSFKKIQEKRKAIMDKLDKATDDKQLKTLVAKNDRKGVAKLIRTYLPWEMMPSFEKQYWENQLSIIEDPLPMDKRILIYRGIEDDLINTGIIKGETLTKDQAFREQKIFLMSTIMTKNQGSWNRRLRSLTAMYEKFIATIYKDVTYAKGARMTTMFRNHAGTPAGSPFMSFTPTFSVAKNFGYNRTTLFFMDPRALHYNVVGLSNEDEFLLPLITFPDELGAVYDSKIHPDMENTEATLKKMAVENLDREFGKGKGAAMLKKIEANSATYFKPINSNEGFKPTSIFFKSMLGKDTAVVAKKITPKTDMQCMDIIQLFWK